MKVKKYTNFQHLAKEYYSGRTFVAFDTETTGLRPSNDYVIEIGAVKFNRNGMIGEPFNTLIKPPVEIPRFITQLTGISDEQVKDAPDTKKALPDFLDFISDEKTMLLAHNAPFDLYFLDCECSRHGLQLPNLQCTDTLPLARWADPELSKLPEKGQYKLQSLASRFNFNVKAAHRAWDDARVCMDLFCRIIQDTLPRQKAYEKYLAPQQPDLQLSLF